jgi:hypothetical protein
VHELMIKMVNDNRARLRAAYTLNRNVSAKNDGVRRGLKTGSDLRPVQDLRAFDRKSSLITNLRMRVRFNLTGQFLPSGGSESRKMNKAFAAAAAAALVFGSISPLRPPGPCLPATFWACMAIPNPPPAPAPAPKQAPPLAPAAAPPDAPVPPNAP